MLREILEKEEHSVSEFIRDFPSVYANLDAACQKLIDIGFYVNDALIANTEYPAFGSILLGIHRNLAVSALRFITRDYDEGMVLLRMSCEQARDLTVLIKNPLLFFLWKRYRTDRNSLEQEDLDRFRKEFKFDLSTKMGAAAKEVYDHTSEVGVHGAGIISNSFRKAPAAESFKLLSLLLSALMQLPYLCRDSMGNFFREHSDLIDQKLAMSVEDFLLDLDLRYSVMSAHLLLANQELNKSLGELGPN